ncbi:MAG: depolymerase [Burkholderiaceae bacterium]
MNGSLCRRGIIGAGLAAASIALGACADDPGSLRAYGADPAQVTVSGFSSGGYMAVQFAVAHSALVRGVGVVAGGPYRCAAGDPRRALGDCLRGAPDPQLAIAEARRLAALQWIDSTDHLRRTRAWLLAGGADEVVARPVVEAARDFFAHFNPGDTRFEFMPGLGHGLPTRAAGAACEASASPYLNRCGGDAAARMLEYLYGTAANERQSRGRLERFRQGEFVSPWRRVWLATSLDREGYVFVPEQCAAGVRCRVHVALHGCRQGVHDVGEAFVRDAGYNGWAAANDTIVLYPQVKPVRPNWLLAWLPNNPLGCWDWWGYTGPDYAVKSGAQIAALHAMVERVTAQRDSAP